MKKFLMLCVCLGVFAGLHAQEKVKWGAVFGMNVAKFSSSVMDSKVGFHLGAKAELEAPKLFKGAFVSASALLSLKGAKIDGGELLDVKYNPWYLEIPVHLGYKYKINDKFSVFGKFGPYFAFGLFGKMKGTTLDWNVDEDYDWSEIEDIDLVDKKEKMNIFGKDAMKRFDFGLGLHAGFEFQKKYQFSIGYDFGLTKTYKDSSEDIDLGDSMKNRNLSISLSYLF